MLRVIFDTNVYGFLIKEPDAFDIERRIANDKNFIVYGFQPIRKEIRDIPKATKLSTRSRHLILGLYDRITSGRFLCNSIAITSLAKKYCDYYRHLGGIYGWDTSIRVDFMIAACATFYGLDIVYSADSKTLRCKNALKAYKHINLRENLRTPDFLKYEELLGKYRDLP